MQLLDRSIDMVPVGAGGGASSTENMLRRRDELMNSLNAAIAAEGRAEQALNEAKAQPNFGAFARMFNRPDWQENVNRAQAVLDAARTATAQASALLTGYINAEVRTTANAS